MKIREEIIEQIHFNQKIADFLDSLSSEDANVAAMTINFIKQTFPECKDVLNGELVLEEVS